MHNNSVFQCLLPQGGGGGHLHINFVDIHVDKSVPGVRCVYNVWLCVCDMYRCVMCDVYRCVVCDVHKMCDVYRCVVCDVYRCMECDVYKCVVCTLYMYNV